MCMIHYELRILVVKVYINYDQLNLQVQREDIQEGSPGSHRISSLFLAVTWRSTKTMIPSIPNVAIVPGTSNRMVLVTLDST